MRIAIYTLGCKVNQYETQAMEQELAAQGHELVDFEQAADAYIINTCSVTAVSDKKSRQVIRRAKNRNPAAIIAACGCYVQTHTDEAAALGIDLIGGTGRTAWSFWTSYWRRRRKSRPGSWWHDALRRHEFEILPAGGHAQPHPRHAEGGGRLPQFLHLLHYPLCPGPGPLPALGSGGPADGAACPPGLPGGGAHGY